MAFGQIEGDEEIQDLLQASVGLNLGLHYLSVAITFDPTVTSIDPKLASQIVWLDCLLTNVDRTVRNTNMLIWNKELWLIDHGASLYFHHSWKDWEEEAKLPFFLIKNHVLLPRATELEWVDTTFRPLLTDSLIQFIVSIIPEEFEYAVIRVVPRVEREEFLNVGVILFYSRQGFLQTRYELNVERLKLFSVHLDPQELREYLKAFEQISKGTPQGGSIGKLPIADRFRWLTAMRSTVVQTSPVHPGLCLNAHETLEKLHTELVL